MSETDRRPRKNALWMMLATGCLAIVALALAAGAFVSMRVRAIQAEQRRHDSERAAVGALKTIAVAEAIFREGDKDNNGALDYGTLSQLEKTQLIDSVLGSGTRKGYLFQVAPSRTTSEFLWFAVASPIEPGVSGDRYFCTNQAGVIVYTTRGVFPLNTTDCAFPSGAYPVGR